MTALLFLWMCIIGMVVFLGYIMMAPFVAYGDTGKILALLSIPPLLSFSLAAFGLISIIIFFRKINPLIIGLLSQLKEETDYTNQKAITLFFVWPVLIGTLFNIILSLPAPTLMSLAFPAVIPLAMMPTMIRLYKSGLTPNTNKSGEVIFTHKIYWPIILLVVILILSRILAAGIVI